MSRCEAELCPVWTGEGCICEALGLDEEWVAEVNPSWLREDDA